MQIIPSTQTFFTPSLYSTHLILEQICRVPEGWGGTPGWTLAGGWWSEEGGGMEVIMLSLNNGGDSNLHSNDF